MLEEHQSVPQRPTQTTRKVINLRKTFQAILAGILLAVVLAACSQSTPRANQCVFITGGGAGDSSEIKDVLYPGEKINKGDNEDWFVPCNSRNYIINAHSNDSGDYHSAITDVKTGKAEDGQAGAKFHITGISMFWALNQKEEVLRQFFPFCQKYACYNTGGDDDQNQAGTNFSSEGWNAMLRENFPYAIERATKRAALEFPPSLVEDSALWADFADKTGEYWMDEIGKATGWDPANPWFCASGGDLAAACSPVRFTVESMEYADASLQGETEAQAAQERQLRDLARATAFEEEKHQVALRERERAAEIARADQQAKAEAAASENALFNDPAYRERRQWEHEERMMEACAKAERCYVGVEPNGDPRNVG